MQDRGVYKEECSMKKVCAALFLIILLLRPLCQKQGSADAAVTCAQLAVILNGLLGRTLSSLDDLQLGMPIFDDNRDAQV